MTVVDVDTGEIIPATTLAKPDIARPGEPISLARITSQCRSIEVWAEHCDSIPDITDARNKLAAIEQYVASTSKDGRAMIAAAQRRLEIRIGILLGAAKVGANQHDEASLASEASELTPNERSQFRKMADHPEIVDAVIDDSTDQTPASRRRALDEINRSTQTEAACQECMTRGGGHRDNCSHAGKPRRTPLPDAAAKAGLELRKAVERVERIVSDDRFAANKEQVAARLRSHLTYVEEAMPGLLDILTTPNQEEQ